jgi:hypothetical protein
MLHRVGEQSGGIEAAAEEKDGWARGVVRIGHDVKISGERSAKRKAQTSHGTTPPGF